MPLWKRLTIILGGVLLIVAVAVARLEYLSQFSPEAPAQDNSTAEIYQHYLESFKASLLLAREWIGEIFGDFVEVVEHSDKAIVALSTVFIAAFTVILGLSTIGLMGQTRNLAQHAADQGDAFLRAERPYVFLHIGSSGVEIVGNGELRFAGKQFRCSFENHGRTVAFFTEMKEDFIVVEGMNDLPPPIDPMKIRGRLVPIGTTATPTIPHNFSEKLLTTAAHTMHEEDSWYKRQLFFQGFVRFSDTFGKHYITGYLALFSPLDNAWVLRGGGKYNYTHEEDPDSIPEWKGKT